MARGRWLATEAKLWHRFEYSHLGDRLVLLHFRLHLGLFDIESQIGAYLVGRVPVGDNASFFSRVGYARTEIDINYGASSQIIQSDGISIGFGGEYMFTDQFGIRGDYTVMDAEDGAFTDAISVFGVSGVFKFGGPE